MSESDHMEEKSEKADGNLMAINSILGYEVVKLLADQVIEKYENAGLSGNQFCKMLNIKRYSWKRFVDGQLQKPDLSLLIKLAHFLEQDEAAVIDLYKHSISNEERKALDNAKRYSFIANHFDLKNLRKIKFFTSPAIDFEAFENRIKAFFSLDSIYEYSNIEVPLLYSRTKRVSSDKMLQFWNTLIRFELVNIDNPNPFDRDRFKTILALFRGATRDTEYGLSKIIQALYECGVTVIVQSYVANTSIRGATFIIKGKPNIVLTNLGKRYATLWQVLAHESYHILTKFDDLARRTYRINGDDKELFDSEIEEEAADQFARQLFLDDDKFEQLERYIASEAVLVQFAQAWNVHPSLIYNIYLKNHADEHFKYAKYLIPSDVTIKNLEVKEPWKKQNIQVPIDEIKKKFSPEAVPSQ